jgi:hypothetical protein
VVAVSAPVLCEPFGVLLPLQPPVAAHDVAPDEVQLNWALAPLAIGDGVAVSVATGRTSIVTLTTVLAPPAPVQVSEYVVLAVSTPVLCEPLNGLLPVHPPDPAQEVAFDEFQVRFDAVPLSTLFCEVLIEAVGCAVEPEEPPPPQDANSSSPPTVATLHFENFMSAHRIFRLCITVTIADCN